MISEIEAKYKINSSVKKIEMQIHWIRKAERFQIRSNFSLLYQLIFSIVSITEKSSSNTSNS
jgi:hypothetical protein